MLPAFLRGAVLCFSAILLVAGAAMGAKPKQKPLVRVLANDRVLIEDAEGAVLACVPSLGDARIPRVSCAIVDFRSGFIVGITPASYFVRLDRTALTVSQEKPGSVDQVLPEPRQARPAFGSFVRHRRGRTLEFRPTARYGFAGTSVGCTVARSGLAVTCFVVDRRFRPRRRSHGFTLGFRTLRAIRIDATGKRAVVFEGRHGA